MTPDQRSTCTGFADIEETDRSTVASSPGLPRAAPSAAASIRTMSRRNALWLVRTAMLLWQLPPVRFRAFVSRGGCRLRERTIGVPAWSHAEVNEVLPVECGEQVGGGRGLSGKAGIHLPLRIEVRALVPTLQRGQACVVERYKRARVVEGRPYDVLQAGALRGASHVGRLHALAVRGEVL